jgi:hypothetical protein
MAPARATCEWDVVMCRDGQIRESPESGVSMGQAAYDGFRIEALIGAMLAYS